MGTLPPSHPIPRRPVAPSGASTAHELELLAGPAFLEALRADLARCRRRAWIEAYIVRDDAVGRAIGALLADAADRGVDVRLMYDPSGSTDTSDDFFDDLEDRGVAVRPFGRPAWLGIFRPGLRDHGRLMVVDDRGYTGGHALGSEWAARPEGGGWEDLSVRVAGPIVEDLAAVFERRFAEARRLTVRDFDTGHRHRDVRFVADSPRRTRLLDRAYLDAIESARSRVWIAHAYYSPSGRFRRSLYRAAKRGVDVRLLLPGRTDLPIIRRAARSEYLSWIRRGIDVFEYRHAVMHSKYALVDDRWAAIGSYQEVPTAAVLSLETAMITTRSEVVARVAEHFERALRESDAMTRAGLARRSVGDRMLDALARATLDGLSSLIGAR